MDVVQKIKDLSKMAFDENGDTRERLNAATIALQLVEQYLLVEFKKKIENGDTRERLNAATIALRLVEQYLLVEFKKKKIEIAASELADFLKKFANPDFVEVVAVQAEKIADSFDRALGSVGRVLGSVKRVSDSLSQSAEESPGRGRRGGKRKYGGR